MRYLNKLPLILTAAVLAPSLSVLRGEKPGDLPLKKLGEVFQVGYWGYEVTPLPKQTGTSLITVRVDCVNLSKDGSSMIPPFYLLDADGVRYDRSMSSATLVQISHKRGRVDLVRFG